MPEESFEPAVRPLDPEGRPVAPSPVVAETSRSKLMAGLLVGLLVVAGIGGAIAWRVLTGSPFAAAEAVPADADLVITMDFLQLTDLDPVDRLIQAFAEPMARHGIIDETPDLDAALREFDDMAEEEIGFRFAEDVLSWIGRSGSIAVWMPESAFALDPYAGDVIPTVLATLEVRDEAKAQAFLDRVLEQARTEGAEVESALIAGIAAHAVADGDEPFFVALHDGRLLIGDSTETLRRAIELDPGNSVAQTDDFQQLAAVIGGDALMTYYMSPSLGRKLVRAYEEQDMEIPFVEQLSTSGVMASTTLDESGLVVRSASPIWEGITASAGSWSARLPADVYGFVDVTFPERYFEELVDGYLDAMGSAGLTEADIESFTSPLDEMLGMSLTDELLPQFGGEIMLAVGPADDGALAESLPLGVLFGLGVDDAGVVERALSNGLELAAEQGVRVYERDGVDVIEADGAVIAATTVTQDGIFASSSPDQLVGFLRDSGGLGAAERYQRVDGATEGDGLAFYLDIAGIVGDFVTDEEVGDVLAPLVAAGAGYRIEGDYQVAEFRLVIDY